MQSADVSTATECIFSEDPQSDYQIIVANGYVDTGETKAKIVKRILLPPPIKKVDRNREGAPKMIDITIEIKPIADEFYPVITFLDYTVNGPIRKTKKSAQAWANKRSLSIETERNNWLNYKRSRERMNEPKDQPVTADRDDTAGKIAPLIGKLQIEINQLTKCRNGVK